MSAGKAGVSRYAAKERWKEKARGYSRRPGSPFYLSPEALKEARAQPHERAAGIWLPVGAKTEEAAS